ncbi:MAG: leucine-rich repeat domain-containing protein, partial [Bacteroidales bacterium]|nr:leucine-rich repeat domain-containing protein [Bacteroidales bacterium]
SSVTQIKYGCFLFANCPSTINVPASVTDIETLAFAAFNLNAINVDENNPNFMSMDKMLFSKDTTTLVECLMTKSGVVTLPQRTRHLAANAFAYCQNITGVTLPEGLESIGYWAFVDNQRLNNIVIPSSVTHIAPGPFVNCPALNNLSIAEGNTHYYMDGMMIYSAGGDSLVSAHKSADSVFLPNTLRYVNGFGGNSNVKYVHVPDGVTTIGNEAFNGSSLRSIDLPSHLHFIDEYAFYYCQSLTRVGMPTILDTMSEGCFHSCNHLTSIEIPNGLRTIPEAAFFMCNSLSNITWGDAVEVIDTCAFGDCSFTELTLPPTLRVVRMTAFIGDYRGRLKRLTFSAPVDTIEVGAFYSQPLQMLRLKNTMPPATTDDGYGTYGCLDGTDADSIVVPCGSLNTWLADSYWGQFADKYVEDCNLGIGDPDVENINIYTLGGRIIVEGAEVETVRIFDITGRSVRNEALTTGVYIVKVGDRPARKIVVMK